MKKYLVIEKRVGYTPLQELEELKRMRPDLEGVPLTYAGRLDPMASGKLLVLVGDECKKRRQYEKLDKEYEFEVLLGFKTDTGDVLGMTTEGVGRTRNAILCSRTEPADAKRREGAPRSAEHQNCISRSALVTVARSLNGKHTLPYPAFSSKTVQGKPLFEYALAGTLDTIEIPTIDVHIYSMEYLGGRAIARDVLFRDIADKIQRLQLEGNTGRVAADFRKDEIVDRWRLLLESGPDQYEVLRFRAIVSSGTYIRTLSSLIAQKLGTEGLAYSIHRTRIGRYQSIIGRLGFWRRTF